MTAVESQVLWRVSEVARALAVDSRTVWRWASAGVIPSPIHIGGATRWRREDIMAFVGEKASEAIRSAGKSPKLS